MDDLNQIRGRPPYRPTRLACLRGFAFFAQFFGTSFWLPFFWIWVPVWAPFGIIFHEFGITFSRMDFAQNFRRVWDGFPSPFPCLLMTFLVRALKWPDHVLRVQFYRFTDFYMSEKHNFHVFDFFPTYFPVSLYIQFFHGDSHSNNHLCDLYNI